MYKYGDSGDHVLILPHRKVAVTLVVALSVLIGAYSYSADSFIKAVLHYCSKAQAQLGCEDGWLRIEAADNRELDGVDGQERERAARSRLGRVEDSEV